MRLGVSIVICMGVFCLVVCTGWGREDGERSREPELGVGSTVLTLQGLAVGALEEGFVDHSWWGLFSAPTGMVPSTSSREASLVCDLFACFEGSV